MKQFFKHSFSVNFLAITAIALLSASSCSRGTVKKPAADAAKAANDAKTADVATEIKNKTFDAKKVAPAPLAAGTYTDADLTVGIKSLQALFAEAQMNSVVLKKDADGKVIIEKLDRLTKESLDTEEKAAYTLNDVGAHLNAISTAILAKNPSISDEQRESETKEKIAADLTSVLSLARGLVDQIEKNPPKDTDANLLSAELARLKKLVSALEMNELAEEIYDWKLSAVITSADLSTVIAKVESSTTSVRALLQIDAVDANAKPTAATLKPLSEEEAVAVLANKTTVSIADEALESRAKSAMASLMSATPNLTAEEASLTVQKQIQEEVAAGVKELEKIDAALSAKNYSGISDNQVRAETARTGMLIEQLKFLLSDDGVKLIHAAITVK